MFGSNSGVFRVLGFIVSPVEKGIRRKKKEKGRKGKGIEKELKERRKEGGKEGRKEGRKEG